MPLKDHVRNLWSYVLPFLLNDEMEIRDDYQAFVQEWSRYPERVARGEFATPRELLYDMLAKIRWVQRQEGLLQETEVPWQHLDYLER